VLIIVATPSIGEGALAVWVYGFYVDLGYLKSDNEPENRT
jgi:hypothetical protein